MKKKIQMLVVQIRISFALTRVSIIKSSLLGLLYGNNVKSINPFFLLQKRF